MEQARSCRSGFFSGKGRGHSVVLTSCAGKLGGGRAPSVRAERLPLITRNLKSSSTALRLFRTGPYKDRRRGEARRGTRPSLRPVCVAGAISPKITTFRAERPHRPGLRIEIPAKSSRSRPRRPRTSGEGRR